MSSRHSSKLSPDAILENNLPSIIQARISNLIDEIRFGGQQIAVVYRTNPSWPFSPMIGQADKPAKNISIHILDSSFNPPTRAHLALAQTQGRHHYQDNTCSANTLLLSISNADKNLSASDATYVQRVEMMILMADSMATSLPSDSGGVAVVIINEPLFAKKQGILADFLPSLMPFGFPTKIELVWQVGLDTLKRLFDPKYYEGNEEIMNQTIESFLCEPHEATVGARFLASHREIPGIHIDIEGTPLMNTYLVSGRIELTEIGRWECSLSSTKVREGVKNEEEASTVNNTPMLSKVMYNVAAVSHRRGFCGFAL